MQSNQAALNGLDDCVKKLNERTVDKLRRKTKENLIHKKELNLREKKNLSTVYDWWKFINELGITQLSYIDVKQNWYDAVEAFNLDYIDVREEGIDALIKIQKTNKSESQCLYKISHKNKFIDSKIINIVDNITEASETENVIVDFRQDESDDSSTDRELTIDDWKI